MMTLTTPLRQALCSIVACLGSLAFASEEPPPNIVFIFSDDQSYETIAHLGGDEVITPNLDRLARNGTSFTNAYNMGAWHGAVCVASRTSLNTGRSIWKAKQISDELDNVVQRGEFWSQLMSKAGYETYMSGKWHVATQAEMLFDHSDHIRGGMPRQTEEGYNRPKPNDTWTPYAREFGGFWEGGEHWSEVLAHDAERFLSEASKEEKPFFMYLAFNAPHDPRQAPKEFVDLYDRDAIKVPTSFLPEYPYKQEIGCYLEADGEVLRDERLDNFPRTPASAQLHRQEYFAAITHMDAQIGRIMDAIEASGKADNTLVIFTSDHGLAAGHHGLLGKQNMYEHSMKPPLIISGPGVPKNQRRDAFVYLQDILPTSLEIAKAPIPDYVEFQSLWPLISDPQERSAYNAIYGCYKLDRQRMIRVGKYKLILYPEAGIHRLFDLEQDPQEIKDIANTGSSSQRIARTLYKQLKQLQATLDDPLDLDPSFPQLR